MYGKKNILSEYLSDLYLNASKQNQIFPQDKNVKITLKVINLIGTKMYVFMKALINFYVTSANRIVYTKYPEYTFMF